MLKYLITERYLAHRGSHGLDSALLSNISTFLIQISREKPFGTFIQERAEEEVVIDTWLGTGQLIALICRTLLRCYVT